MALPADRVAGRVNEPRIPRGQPGRKATMANVPQGRRWRRSRFLVSGVLLMLISLLLGAVTGGVYLLGWDPLEWAGSLPGIGPVVSTYRMGLQIQAELAEAKKGIAAEMTRLEQIRQELAKEQERLQGEAFSLERERAELAQERAELARERAELVKLQDELELQRRIARIYQYMRPAEIAEILAVRPVEEAAQVLLALPEETAGAVLAALNPLRAAMVLEVMRSSAAKADVSEVGDEADAF
ncbi:MAG: hypothetical protein IMX00_06875 [Limnochordales bacterium]|nr:hypothetical protein [Limnochordales bacterium]